jgi:hypothetical protein
LVNGVVGVGAALGVADVGDIVVWVDVVACVVRVEIVDEVDVVVGAVVLLIGFVKTRPTCPV